MSYHHWGDDWPYWNQLHSAIGRILRRWRRWGRIGAHGKEKYGTFRDNIWGWDGSLQYLVYPGYVRTMWGKFYWHFDRPVISRLLWWTGIAWLIRRWQRFVYNAVIQIECRRCPEITDELVSDLDLYEWVTPGMFGDVDGTEIHKKYWRVVGDE
jgi:hypothetical protein